jgi:hypothetical protein
MFVIFIIFFKLKKQIFAPPITNDSFLRLDVYGINLNANLETVKYTLLAHEDARTDGQTFESASFKPQAIKNNWKKKQQHYNSLKEHFCLEV